MADYLIKETSLISIADKTRNLSGKTDDLTISEIIDAIEAEKTYLDATLAALADKGVEVPEGTTNAGLADLITNAEFGGSSSIPEFTYTGTYVLLEDGDDNWRIKFLTSGTLTFTKDVGTIDVFLCGGGAGGRTNSYNYSDPGGGGGYTTTGLQAITPIKGTEYSIVVGAGGAANTNGGSSTAFGLTANGGKAGSSLAETHRGGGDYDMAAGGAGGSGGGGASAHGHGLYSSSATKGANGGIDGANGSSGAYDYYNDTDITYNWFGGSGGEGQKKTTREFGATVTNAYIVGTTNFSSDWLSLTRDGEALTPEDGVVYSVMTSGDYYYCDFIWNGTAFAETNIAEVYGCGGGAGAPSKSGSIGGYGYKGAANGTSYAGVLGTATPNKGGGGGGDTAANKGASAGGSGIVIIRNARTSV